MKLYHKILLYQNKLLRPYVNFVLRLLAILTTLASILLIVAIVYQHGFRLSAEDREHLMLMYKTVWIVFLVEVSAHQIGRAHV